MAGCGSQTSSQTAEPAQAEAVQEAPAEEAGQNSEAPAQEAEAENSEDAAEPAKEEAATAYEKFESDDGWYVMYDSNLIDVETSEDGVSFTYTGESEGLNEITVNYFMNRMPDEVLYDAIATDEGLPEHERSEDYFAGDTNVWAMRVSVTPEEGSDKLEEFIAVEHNGGTLLIQIDSCVEEDEETGMKISDTLSAILDSFTFTDHEEQTYSAYVPGKYVREETDEIDGKTVTAEYYVELNKDHTGVVSMQDEVPVIWYSREGILLNAETGEQIYEYAIEGDTLYLIDRSGGGEAVTFDFERE